MIVTRRLDWYAVTEGLTTKITAANTSEESV
jgi:inner membrane protein involved in colicin E2 resistance